MFNGFKDKGECVMKIRTFHIVALALVVLLGMFAPARAAGLRGLAYSPHNFSMSRPAGAGNPVYRASEEARLCVFCHTPHHATGEGPLWSRDISNQDNYKMYESATMTASIEAKPTGASRLCLSCHDGTIAVGTLAGGYVLTEAPVVTGSAQIGGMNAGRNDLSADHPISFIYPAKAGLANPDGLLGIKLGPNNRVECTACHDPHNNEFGKFLVKNDIDGTVLCTSCHLTPGWVTAPYSIHKTGIPVGPTTGCKSCHQSHKAPGPRNLLKGGAEELNCSVAGCHQDVALAITGSAYAHPVSLNNGIHNRLGVETLPMQEKHAKCVDCHNPHQATKQPAPPALGSFPRTVNGPLAGMTGISMLGSPVAPAQYEYEVCFRCHTGPSAANFVGLYGTDPYLPDRVMKTADVLLSFGLSNPTYHPVLGKTNQPAGSFAVNSLLSLTPDTIIYCSDCHSSHGSQIPHILKGRYTTRSELYLDSKYELCYTCHNKDFINNPSQSGFPMHASHLNPVAPGRNPVPCSGCHDPHGVVGSYHLINFDRNLLPNPNVPIPTYQHSTGAIRGTCTVSCHSTGTFPNIYTHSYP
jgi:predicted CXXCH cytochrome family protein